MSLLVTGGTVVGLLGLVAIAGVLMATSQTVPEWLVAIISAGFGGGIIHTGSKIGGS